MILFSITLCNGYVGSMIEVGCMIVSIINNAFLLSNASNSLPRFKLHSETYRNKPIYI
jgi:hypothetical protein